MNVRTIKVTIEVTSWLKRDFGHEGQDRLLIEETVPTGTFILDLLRVLAGKYPVFGKKAFVVEHNVTFDYCSVIWNGTFLPQLPELDTKMKDGDTIKLIPNLYGG